MLGYTLQPLLPQCFFLSPQQAPRQPSAALLLLQLLQLLQVLQVWHLLLLLLLQMPELVLPMLMCAAAFERKQRVMLKPNIIIY